MKQFSTDAIILARTNFGEADRILTFLTPDHGKVKAIAKSVRKSKSKLAGGIELFSVCQITVIVGRGEINTLISARLKKHYGDIVKDLDRTNAAYEFIGLISKNTEEEPESGYFNLLNNSLAALDDSGLDIQLVRMWFHMQLLKLTGHAPNLHSDTRGDRLKTSETYGFVVERMHFTPEPKKQGAYRTNHIKFLRVGFSASSPAVLQRVQGIQGLIPPTHALVRLMTKSFLRV